MHGKMHTACIHKLCQLIWRQIQNGGTQNDCTDPPLQSKTEKKKKHDKSTLNIIESEAENGPVNCGGCLHGVKTHVINQDNIFL